MYNKQVMKSNLHSGQEVKKTVRKKTSPAVLITSTKAKTTSKKPATVTLNSKAKPKTVRKQTVALEGLLSPKVKRSRTTNKKMAEPVAAQSVPTTKEVVYMPSSASLRLLEKVELYRLWYQNKFPSEVARLAQVSGYAFVIIGTLFASFSYGAHKIFDYQPAALVCSEVDCVEVSDANLVPTAPLVTFLNSLPAELNIDTDITLRSRSLAEPSVYVHVIETGVAIPLTATERMKDGEFRYLLEPQKLGAGHFELVATMADAEKSYKFVGPTFFVPGLETAAVAEPQPVMEPATTIETASTSATTTETELSEPVPVTALLNEDMPLQMSLEGTADAEYLKIKTGTYVPEEVLVYSKISPNSSAILLGAATPIGSEWVFSLSALDLPQVTHELTATFSSQGRDYQTPMVKYAPVANPSAALATEADISLLVSKITLALETAEVQNLTRFEYFTYVASTSPNFFDTEHEKTFATAELSSLADEVLSNHSDLINTILFKFALVSGGTNRYLEDYSVNNMREFYEALARDQVSAREYGAIATLLSSRFEALRARISETEQRLADEARSLTETDTDRDGLADFDELANLKTDPAKADTDLDGVLDGIEFVGNTDPNISDVVSFPDNTSQRILVSDTPVQLTSVRAVTHTNNGQTKTYPVFQGTALPYSYVYILIKGAPSAGVIKTGADGAFQYTYERVLNDGNYEVSAALVTADGNLIGETKPIVFTKKADNLTATALFSEATMLPFDQTGSRVPYVVAAAIAVVTFGFVLILLAQSLLVRRRDTIKAS